MKAATDKDSSPVEKKRVFLVDDHTILREGLGQLLNQSSDLMICGEASTSEEALNRIPAAKPNLVVVDLSLPDTGGMELLRLLKLRHPDMPALVLSMHDESVYAKRALRAGAKGYIMKHEAITEVQVAIRRILEGGLYLSRKVSDWLVQSAVSSRPGRDSHPINGLSDREFEVFEMIGRGLGTSEIARQLHLSVKTIETYQAKLKEKLDLADAQKLFQFALKWVESR
ncbi:MAG TPA: response regulator transcription factor [Planctomycetota bacterium]|nr:response regulator transcription factor [Planctomycetota bacterium]